MIIRGENERKIYINEINTIIIQSTAVSITTALLSELIKQNIKVIFCDEKCNPQSDLLPYYGAHNTSKRYKQQILWDKDIKKKIWDVIIKQKITNQANLLLKRGYKEDSDLLIDYANDVHNGDETNREGHAAKVYFNCLLPKGVSRQDGGFVNGCLNYGYSVILSAFNREIVACGYLTQLGIWHDNEFNQFNLSSDLMEPFRSFVDEIAFGLHEGDKEFKRKMVNVLNVSTTFNGKQTTMDIAIRQYVYSVITSIEKKDTSFILFPQNTIIDNE